MTRKRFARLATRVGALDVELAKNGLAYARDLKLRAVRVGFVILEHFNRRTGQCDPGIKRICRSLGLSRSTVLRALDELCSGPNPYIFRDKHGGSYDKNLYRPNFDKLIGIALELQERAGIRKKSARDRRSQQVRRNQYQYETPLQSQQPTPKPNSKPIEKPTNGKCTEKGGGREQQRSLVQTVGKLTNGLLTKMRPEPTRAEIARTQAEKRLMEGINAAGRNDLYERLTEDTQIYDQAVAAEIQKRGSGIERLLRLPKCR